MDWKFLWYALSTLLGVVSGAIGTAWTWGRKYQSIIQTQKEQGQSLAELRAAHEANKAEVDKRLAKIDGQMIRALADLKQSVAVIGTQVQEHVEHCVSEKELADNISDIKASLAHLQGHFEQADKDKDVKP
jgi:DNA repair exonuclease SbcCD ATPase subunit